MGGACISNQSECIFLFNNFELDQMYKIFKSNKFKIEFDFL